MSVYERLSKLRNEKYRDFQSKLVPNISKDLILGVKTPEMRKIAKDIKDTQEAEDFLKELPHKYYEENLVHFFLIAMIKDFDKCVEAVETFLPYVDCWPVCDQASPNVFKKNHAKILPLIKKWIDSDHVYTSRFGMRMLMNEFLGDDFKPEYLEWVASVKGEDYYVKMMVAWYFATALAKQYDESVVYIEKRRLDPWTHKKAIQKAIESFRVSDEHKEFLKTLR
ncbi:3-methyladenine DNA glycosylase AlkD [Butyrivibrio fibrisolvens DSM 3071]|uniref:3-methyladenine DNA glycosylase AlkD n=1 Tax=Butyrivibrio fibrisolvens DSM 3071 TaxID=1121131 RepID=A0A1M5ZGH0_BUTFI|nr:DNA alkylation repair protein [Butyrivibrio fibrisolvens]SHI23289.1 3-methyladenine DNA glycosylase AlkD [Butyrivibrio fibrisolvens DSM 3071]